MFASVYRAMRDVGLPDPRRVDEMELWEIAVAIGADDHQPDNWWEGWAEPTEADLLRDMGVTG